VRNYHDAKAMAQTLRKALSAKQTPINHSESLEIIAKVLGVRDWNTLAAAIQAKDVSSLTERILAGKSGARRLKRSAIFPVIPLRDIVIFPGNIVPVFAGRERSLRAIEQASDAERRIVLVAQKFPTDDDPDAKALYRMGVLGSVLNVVETPEGWRLLNIQGHQRVFVEEFTAAAGFYQAKVSPVEEEYEDNDTIEGLSQEVSRRFRSYAYSRSPKLLPLPDKRKFDPVYLADAIAPRLPIPINQKQALLETTSVAKRLADILLLLQQDQQV
jgi:ATP-dependent Lon protease